LYAYEVLMIYIANSNGQYRKLKKSKSIEIDLGPHQQWICLLLDGQRNTFNETSICNCWVGIELKETSESVQTFQTFH
ncbi:hypothetical protein GCK32_002121, partial [Trichostrongylus colubriformis]